jgi:antitoxin (DNA-binding transcriptional repressor) of toxin-antitoxin stability system
MTTMSVHEAQAQLPELIDKLQPGEEVVITKEDQPIAKLVGTGSNSALPRQPGSAKGLLIIVNDDDDYLEDFKEYLP